MKKYQQAPDHEIAPPAAPLGRTTTDNWGKPRQCAREDEDRMTEADGRLTKRVLVSAFERAVEKEALMGPTESTAKFFDEMDRLGAGGRVISRGRAVGFVGRGGAFSNPLNRRV